VAVLPMPFDSKQAGGVLERVLAQGAATLASYRAVLDEVTLLDVLQIKVFSGSSATLNVIGGRGENGAIFLDRGSICHATARRKGGLDAFHDILSWPCGSIEQGPLPEQPLRTITVDTPTLLMEAARRMDEQRNRIDSTDPLNDTAPIRHDVNGRTVHLGDEAEERLELLHQLPKFLVVDDNPMILRYADEVLARHWTDHAIITVQTVAEARACILEFRPRILVLDLVLPDGSGEDLARELTDHEATASMPIIMISGRIDDLRDIARECPNVVATLAKPFAPNQFIEAVRAAESFVSV
jgi:CheY-like chemotaxis protein